MLGTKLSCYVKTQGLLWLLNHLVRSWLFCISFHLSSSCKNCFHFIQPKKT